MSGFTQRQGVDMAGSEKHCVERVPGKGPIMTADLSRIIIIFAQLTARRSPKGEHDTHRVECWLPTTAQGILRTLSRVGPSLG